MLGTSKLLPTSACVEVRRQDSCFDISSTSAFLDGIQSWYCIESIKISQNGVCTMCQRRSTYSANLYLGLWLILSRMFQGVGVITGHSYSGAQGVV
jgi:hypothetical protein